MIMAGHQDQTFVAYPIDLNTSEKGKALINWIAELTIEDGLPSRADWNKNIDKQKFAPEFAKWNFDWLDVPQLIDQADAVYEFPMVDRDRSEEHTSELQSRGHL